MASLNKSAGDEPLCEQKKSMEPDRQRVEETRTNETKHDGRVCEAYSAKNNVDVNGLSKKERRQQAIMRAQMAMENDRKQVEENLKKTGVSINERPSQGREEPKLEPVNHVPWQEEHCYELAPKRQYQVNRTLITAILVAFAGCLLLFDGNFKSNRMTHVEKTIPNTEPPASYLESAKVQVERSVPQHNQQTGKPCSGGGECSTVSVENPDEVAPNGTEFTSTENYIKYIALWTDILRTRSVNFQCSFPFSSEMPKFRYRDLVVQHSDELVGNPWDVNVLQMLFVTETRDDGFFIGLPEDFKLRYPFICWTCISFKQLMILLCPTFARWSYIIVSIAWAFFMAHPLSFVVFFVVFYFLKCVQDYKAHSKQVLTDITASREMAYDLLQGQPDLLLDVSNIRDHICDRLFFNSHHYFFAEVWPHVMIPLLEDDRIRKLYEKEPWETPAYVAMRGSRPQE